MTVRKACPHCGGEIGYEEGRTPLVCPFCAKPFVSVQPSGPSPLEMRLLTERSPKEKYRIIQEALRVSPGAFEANAALLFHGRLHEPMRKGMDFSIIKCHLLSVFDTPQAYSQAQRAEKLHELLHGAQLEKTMALAPDAEAFFVQYLRRLCHEYVDLFIRGDSKNSRAAFGFGRSSDSMAKRCAAVVRHMLDVVRESEELDDAARRLLSDGLTDGYAASFPGCPVP